ncbi:MAG: FHA domain-containing protein [Phycisphaeraceae bacterium]|nr:FHA domain-containing protein [Phycisphaerales bacterium]MCB9860261.1 FHA domain-containing protein [Phycisphaeraceae bacterium]
MSLELVLIKKDGSTREIPLGLKHRVIGREKGCDVRIPAGAVSRKHCEINFDEDEDEITIKDLGSANGTYVNGERVEQMELSPGDVIVVGPAVFVARMHGFPKDIDTDGAIQYARKAEAAVQRAKSGVASPPLPEPVEKIDPSAGSDFFDDFDFGDDDNDE